MQTYLRQLSVRLYQSESFVKRWRQRRMTRMLQLVRPPRRARIVDFGGTTYNWELIDHDFHVTLVNLPSSYKERVDESRYSVVEGDACNLASVFDDHSFDMVFSNSTIEHVGNELRQRHFAHEVCRLANAYWIQTPSSRCIVEVHTGVPFYWKLPAFVRQRLHASWKAKLGPWYEMIESTRVLSRCQMQELFPESRLYVERVCGFEKSYSAYLPCYE